MKKVRFTSSFAFYSIFKIRATFDFQALFCCASVKVLDNCNSTDLFCQGLFSCFENFFSLYLKVIQLLQALILQSQSRLEKTYFITFALGVAFKMPLCYYSFAGREKYPRGRRGGFAKALGRATGAGVRIPPSPPSSIKPCRHYVCRAFLFPVLSRSYINNILKYLRYCFGFLNGYMTFFVPLQHYRLLLLFIQQIGH